LPDILRDPERLHESEMGNLVADSMRAKYPGVDAAYTNSGGLRANLVFAPPSAGEQPGEITWGEMFAVLPFGNRSVILTLTGAQLETAFLNGFTRSAIRASPAGPAGSRRSPASRCSSTARGRRRSSTRSGRHRKGSEARSRCSAPPTPSGS
jgi:2',3'-cyclic-nucleotide 2'-phosphodiesterase (5'-nucleotidase family)